MERGVVALLLVGFARSVSDEIADGVHRPASAKAP
jgi:hypothetical protein